MSHPYLEVDCGRVVCAERAQAVRKHSPEPGESLERAPCRKEGSGQVIIGRQGVGVLGTKKLLARGCDLVPVCRGELRQTRVLQALAHPEEDLVAGAGPEPVSSEADDARGARPQALSQPVLVVSYRPCLEQGISRRQRGALDHLV